MTNTATLDKVVRYFLHRTKIGDSTAQDMIRLPSVWKWAFKEIRRLYALEVPLDKTNENDYV